MNEEPKAEDLNPQDLIDSQLVKILETMDINGTKRHHISHTLDFDKDNPQPVADTSLALVSTLPTQGEWCKVQKKKGQKHGFFPTVHYFLASFIIFDQQSTTIDGMRHNICKL